MAFPKGLLGEGYLKLSEPDRTPLKIKYGFAKSSQFHKDFPMKEYGRLDLAGKNALREKWHMTPLAGLGYEGSGAKKPESTFKKSIKDLEAVFPRTTAGAVAFIKAWNKATDGNEFVSNYADGSPDFWRAATHRAVYLRAKGVNLKTLKKTRGEETLYDWDLLKAAAAEGGV